MAVPVAAVSAVRAHTLEALDAAGLDTAGVPLPPERVGGALRPAGDIVHRFAALHALVAYVGHPAARANTARAAALLAARGVRAALTAREAGVFDLSAAAAARVAASWLDDWLEGILTLAWVLGNDAAPAVDGVPASTAAARHLLTEGAPTCAADVEVLLEVAPVRHAGEVVAAADAAACALAVAEARATRGRAGAPDDGRDRVTRARAGVLAWVVAAS